jgi:PIN domain nuclease of toxin-antitoxin system
VSEAFLADACALLAFFTGFGMTPVGIAAMQGDVSISAITVWELARKSALGKLPPLPGAPGLFSDYLTSQGFAPLPLTWSDAERANQLPPLHKDPMDRMLIAQAQRTGMTVITDDGLFPQYAVTTVW